MSFCVMKIRYVKLCISFLLFVYDKFHVTKIPKKADNPDKNGCQNGTTKNVIMNFEYVKFVMHKNDINNLT